MTAVQFSGSSASADRRRRLMVAEIDATSELAEESVPSVTHQSGQTSDAFPMLTRDRLIRRVISPRLWKHVTVAVVLTLTPIIYAIVTWRSSGEIQSADSGLFVSRMNGLRGLSALKLFAAGQFCLLIAWVRSASPVDFRGRFRWWRWLALILFAVSATTLTGSSEWFINLLAQCLEPVFGRIDAARPALVFVPACACIAIILRHVIPDMGRCRASQSLIVISAILLAVRSFGGAREHSTEAVFHLATLELLISGLVLSAFQLHARFVIHVNPHPPIAVERKFTVRPALPEISSAVESSSAPANDLQQESSAAAEREAVTDTLEAAAEPQPAVTAEFIPVEEPSKPAVAAAGVELGQSQASKGKSGKKQKYRKAG